MPIEFRCPGCSKLLRTGDDTAGKKARCPECGTVVSVPDPHTQPPSDDVRKGTEQVPPPFRPTSPDPTPPSDEQVNPYAAPSPFAFESTAAPVTGELTPTQISVEDLLSTTWTLFSDKMGPLAIFGVIIFAVNMALQIVGQFGGIAASGLGGEIASITFSLINAVVAFCIQMWIAVATIAYMLKFYRTGEGDLSQLTAVGPYFLRAVGASLIVALLVMVIGGICAAPGAAMLAANEEEAGVAVLLVGVAIAVVPIVIISLRYTIMLYFIVDRDAGVLESLRLSAEFMKGNKFTALLAYCVVGILGMVFVCCTLFLGQILYIPFYGLLKTVLYLSVTGQLREKMVT